MARLNRRYRKRKRRNPDEGGGTSRSLGPPLLAEVGEFVLPGFAGFAATRFGTRIAAQQIGKKFPNTSWGKHAGAVASVGAFLAAWLLAHKWKWLEKYQMPVTVGAALAAIQSIIQLYVPKLGWMIADASPELAAGADAQSQLQTGGGGTTNGLPAGMTPIDDDPNLYVYNDQYDPGNYAPPATGTQQQAAAAPSSNQDNYDDLAVDGMGIFASN